MSISVRKLTVGILLLMLYASGAKGACRHWENGLSVPSDSWVYAGTIGDRPVRVKLHLDVATGQFDGAYGYNDERDTLNVTGRMLPGGAGIFLYVRNAQGQLTGYLDLAFFQPLLPWENPGHYMKQKQDNCFYLTGSWQPPSKTEGLYVQLYLASGEFDPSSGNHKVIDDAAYKLRKAILENNRKAFAALFQYPFYTYKNTKPPTMKQWRSPKSVIDHYNEIMPFSHRQVYLSVPHFLSGGFMNRSVYFNTQNGKITYICAGACPALP